MWLVWLALRRPYTFVVMAILIVVIGTVSVLRMPTDMFPNINIPVISVVWNYTGISPEDMEKRIVFSTERILGTTVNGIEHTESQSLLGVGVIKVFFYEGVKIEGATAQVTAVCQTILRGLPPGTTPPLIIQYNASTVPVLQASLSSPTLPEATLFDLGFNVFRQGLVSVKGAQMPYPYGGKQRAIMVDLDPAKMYSFGLSANDVSSAFASQSLILPAGYVRFGQNTYSIITNGSPLAIGDYNNIPLKTINGTIVYVKDIAWVHDGYLPQTTMVHIDGQRGVLLPVLKGQGASTIQLVSDVLKAVPEVMKTLPKSLHINWVVDQSKFVWAAIQGVMFEAILAACLTGLMILLFLGSWRSTLVTVISIPLSIMVSLIVLAALGETINIMTLGGLALAVGILVDDATVTIENIHRNLGQRKPLTQAIVDGAQQIAVPAFVSTLCICIVFVPVVFITGAAKYLFTPLAMAVVFAMLTSYVLSRTLVPTMVQFLLPSEVGRYSSAEGHAAIDPNETNPIWWVHGRFNRVFEGGRRLYGRTLAMVLEHRIWTCLAFLILIGSGLALFPFIGEDFFPTTDAGQMRLHVRCPAGTRIEESEVYFGQVSDHVRRLVPASELASLIDNIGIPNSSINLSLSDGSLNSQGDGEILISLSKKHRPTEYYESLLRRDLRSSFPTLTFFFAPADISAQILNFGLSAPIDVQVGGSGAFALQNEAIARQILAKLTTVPGAVDVHLQQSPRSPAINVEVDRIKAADANLSELSVSSSILTTLSSSAQTSPQFYLDAAHGISYNISLQSPLYRMSGMQDFSNMPVGTIGPNRQQTLGNVSTITRTTQAINITHYNVLTTYDVLANVERADLGSVAKRIDAIIKDVKSSTKLPAGTVITVRGQIMSMRTSFNGLEIGICFSILLVYLLMVVNFQSWLDPLIILGALPGALSGILWMLFLTNTHISVPALMGAIMSIGVATANSILMVSFANDQRGDGHPGKGLGSNEASLLAGITRLRPVVMTALAMIIGMLPMSLGLSEGGEQNAPLGRAVIGGLLLATLTTLFFVPMLYSVLRRRQPTPKIAMSAPHAGQEPHHD